MTIDTTESFGPVPTGWVDPAEPILSDEETEPIHVPVMHRVGRNRVFKHLGLWFVGVANVRPYFPHGTFLLSVKAHDTFEEALDTVRLEIAKAAS